MGDSTKKIVKIADAVADLIPIVGFLKASFTKFAEAIKRGDKVIEIDDISKEHGEAKASFDRMLEEREAEEGD